MDEQAGFRRIDGVRMATVNEVIEFSAEIIKVQQLQNDLAIRITLDLPESCIMQMAQLAECKRAGAVLHIRAEPIIDGQPEKSRKIHI